MAEGLGMLEGTADGVEDGAITVDPVGPLLGSWLRTGLGPTEGVPVLPVLDAGRLLGPLDGVSNGTADGDTVCGPVGASDRLLLGPPVGDREGPAVFAPAGSIEGFVDGVGVIRTSPAISHGT
jgi:hypothetical protein